MNVFKKMRNILNDPKVDFRERSFMLLTVIADFGILLVWIGDIILGEDAIEIAALGGTLLLSPFVAYLCLKYHKVQLGGIIFALSAALILLPVTFFFGGGLYGGSVIWFSFAFLYIGMVLTGGWRTFLYTVLMLVAGVEYYIGYFHSELVVQHSVSRFYLHSLVSVVLVGMVTFGMILFSNRLFILENQRAKEEAEKVEELRLAQNRFFSSMSHEIRTPINTIIGLNEMILREDISDEVAEDASNVRSASKMLLHLINDILDMTKLDSGQMQLTPVNYKPGDMLSELVGMLWLRAKEKGLGFHVSVAPDLPSELIGDEVRIYQILINVVNNAIKYTKQGDVSLTIQCGKREGSTLHVIYSVTDTGVGIKKENIPHLFTAFRRVEEMENRHIEGTGLGLSIVKQLVDLMGGTITVNSIYTKGTTFIIEIPQQVASEEQIKEISLDSRQHMGYQKTYQQKFEAPDAKILVVDDNASNLLVVTKLLRDTKVKIDTAGSGAEALKKTLAESYHVIFMDHLMPEMDGLECRRLIRSQMGGKCKEARIVALTANAGGDSRALYEKEGFDGYLVKPISGEELERELCRLLPHDLMYMTGSDDELFEDTVSWMHADQGRRSIVITTDSVADLPHELTEQQRIEVLPHMVITGEGTFRDGLEIETDGILGYMQDPTHKVGIKSPSVSEHEKFFAEQLSHANNVIHITISSTLENSGCQAAKEAADAFDNVTVVESGHLSTGQGIMVLEACKLAASGKTVPEIVEALEQFRTRINTSFIVKDLEYLARAGQVSAHSLAVTKAFLARPILVMKHGRLQNSRVLFGSRENTWKQYIRHTLSRGRIDDDILFITHVGLTNRELEQIKAMALERVRFKHVYFVKASPAIAVNCGPGTFGLLFKYQA